MLKLKRITIKNFLSVGNVPQVIDLDATGLTLIMGENLDAIGDPNAARNGTGKSTIVNAISFALFSWPITPIKKDNLVNKSNSKEMEVILDFEKDGINYRIERGRKPTFTRWYVGDREQLVPDNDESHGDSKWTNAEIVKVLGLSPSLFKHIIALNTYTTPFLNLAAKDQREIIEELLGITMLSLKADKLKALLNGDKALGIDGTKDYIKEEEIKIEAITKANEKVEKIISDLENRKKVWDADNSSNVKRLNLSIDKLSHVDIDAELVAHDNKAKKLENDKLVVGLEKELTSFKALKTKLDKWDDDKVVRVLEYKKAIDELSHINIENELAAHENKTKKATLVTEISHLETSFKQKDKNITRLETLLKKEQDNLAKAVEHNCPTCGQEIHDSSLDELIEELNGNILKHTTDLKKEQDEVEILEKSIEEKNKALGDLGDTKTYYNKINDAYNHRSTIEQLEKDLEREEKDVNPYLEQVNEIDVGMIEGEIEKLKAIVFGNCKTYYDTVDEAYEHRLKLEKLISERDREVGLINPFIEQINQTRDDGLQVVNRDRLESLYMLRDHQAILLKLLTDKNSFIRKKIIDQNLAFLNHRLNHYIAKLGLPHEVKFMNDLNVEITYLGHDYDAGNLSRGEHNRLILGLSWAFRDIWESMNTNINLFFIDEILDSGLDTIGVETAYDILKTFSRDRAKSVFLISHREELLNRSSNVLKVIKENSFTSFMQE
jgi:DNA repair exonuclease SbcCD ATPase subunit